MQKAQAEIFEKCKAEYNPSTPLLAWGCCGMKAFQFRNQKYNSFSVTDLKILRYTQQQKEDLLAIDATARKIKGFYVYQRVIYHLHPEFIE